jgi:hypothetical protein
MWPVVVVSLLAKDKVFFLGPMKTGTTTLSKMFAQKGYATCHGECPSNWAVATTEHAPSSSSSSLIEGHDAFMDHGDHADYAWLASQYPAARFVLNTRRLKTWITSRADHARRNRVAAGCAPWGDKSSCPHAESNFVDNSVDRLKKWVLQGAVHQDAVLCFFNRTSERRQRFTVVDVEGQSATSLNLLLDWVTRPHLGVKTTSTVVLRPKDVPLDSARHHIIPPDANSNAHTGFVKERVESVLRSLGCTAVEWNDIYYHACARAIARSNRPTRKGLSAGAKPAKHRARSGE